MSMGKAKWLVAIGVVAIVAWHVGGCTGGLGGLIPEQAIDLPLGTGLGEFDVQAGVPATKTGSSTNFDTRGITLGRGSIELSPSDIAVTPADSTGSKGTVNLQQTSTLTVTVWIAPLDQLDTVCESGEEYGPFEVTLDENYVPTAIDPSKVTMTQDTVDLLNAGAFSLCIEVVSPVDGTVSIANLTFNLGL